MSQVIFFASQLEFHHWLLDNHASQTECWVGIYKKVAGKSGISLKEAADEALCFGWAEAIRKSIDVHSYAIRYVPRKAKSKWSEKNVKMMEALIEAGLAHPEGIKKFNERKIDPTGQGPISLFLTLCLLFLGIWGTCQEEQYSLIEDISYYSRDSVDAYLQERCKLDLYHPDSDSIFPTIVWFHGGGLKAGNKFIPEGLKEQGVAVATVNYRLHPQVKHPTYIQDAAAAVAWVYENISTYGGHPQHIYVSGHSAGGYLASMVGLDKQWLAPFGIDPDSLAGLIPFSGHTITHFTIRSERGIPGTQAIIDEYAPQYHVRVDAPPLVLITGDRDLELLGRYEENAFMWRMMQIVGHPDTYLHELEGFDHGSMLIPAQPLLLSYVKKWERRP